MRVLLVESCPGTSDDVRTQLTDAGHEVVECFDDTAPLCVGIDDARRCPLGHPVDVAIAVRVPGDGAAKLHEMGAVCALRHRVPLVEYPGLDTSPFHGRSTATSGDLIGAIDDAAAQAGPHALAATAAIRGLPGLTDRDPGAAFATTERDGKRLHVVVHLPAGIAPEVAGMAATVATRAVREVDPYVSVIDVSLADR
jgi:hypothetical protein